MIGNGVRIRAIEHADLAFLRDLANDPQVRANVAGWDWPLSLAQQEQWFAAGQTTTTRRFMVESDAGELLGMTGLWDIDWHNRTALSAVKLGVGDVRGKGYGTATVRLMMDFAFRDVGLNKLYSTILATNHASLNTYIRKSGWQEEGRLRDHVWRDGQYADLIQVGILRSDYERWLENESTGDVS